jgi:hypothetical protein
MGYLDYYLPDSWYEPDYEPEYECWKCDEKDKVIENAQDFFSGIVDMLYGKVDLDVDHLDNMIEELGSYLDVNIPSDAKNILKKDNMQNVLQSWIKFNNNHLKALA